jgi:sortase A
MGPAAASEISGENQDELFRFRQPQRRVGPFAGMALMRRQIRLVQHGLIATGVLALGYCLAVYLDEWRFQVVENRRFSGNPRRNAATPKVSLQHGAVLGRLEIPGVGVSVMVVEGVEDGDLKRAAGHIRGTALPGQAGNIGIAAHRDTFFRPLGRIQQSDLIMLSTVQGAYRYRVVSTDVVSPNAIQVLYPTANDSLTLVTCFPFNYIGPAPKRFVIRARRLQE